MPLLPLLGMTLAAVAPAAGGEGPFRALGYDEARAAAGAEQRTLFVDFFTTWCAPCKKLDAVTWTDPRVLEFLLRETVPVKIDAEAAREVSSLYEIAIFPTLLFATPEGAEIGRLPGYYPPERFLPSAERLLAAHSPAAAGVGSEFAVALARADRAALEHRPREAFEEYEALLARTPAEDLDGRRRVLERLGELANAIRGPVTTRLRELAAEAGARALAAAAADEEADPSAALATARAAAADVAVLAAVLKESRHARKLFEELLARERETPARAAALGALLPEILEGLVLARDSERLAQLERQLEEHAARRSEELRAAEATYGGNERALTLLSALRERTVRALVLVFEAHSLCGRDELAAAAAARAVELDPTSRGYQKVIGAARRIGRLELALAWVEAGLAVLPVEQHTTLVQLQRVLQAEIPK